jgi:hypothetical protein
MMSTRILPVSLRRAAWLPALALAPALATCTSDEARAREKLAGEYVSTVDRIVGGERTRERHILRLTEDGYWIRTGGTQLGNAPIKASHDSGTYRVEGTLMTLRSQVDDRPLTLRYTIAGDTIIGYNRAMAGMDKQARFVRR